MSKRVHPVILALILLIPFAGSSQVSSWNNVGIGGGGAFFSPSINPSNPSEFSLSSDMSELFYTLNFGNQYTFHHFSTFTAGHASELQYTNNANQRYGIRYNSPDDDTRGVPSLTLNGGTTWANLPGIDANENYYSVYADYAHPERSVTNDYSQLFFSNNFGSTCVVKFSTVDGAGLHIAGTYFDADTILVGTNQGLLMSTNGGNTFTNMGNLGMPAGQVMYSFAAGRSAGVLRLIAVAASVGDVYAGVLPYEMWAADGITGIYGKNGINTNWANITGTLNLSEDRILFARMGHNSNSVVYLAGGNPEEFGVVWKSINGGSSWTEAFIHTNNGNVQTGWGGQGGDRGWGFATCITGISVSRNNPDSLVVVDFGFVHTSANGGANWKQAYTDQSVVHPPGQNTPQKVHYTGIGIENTSCWQVSWTGNNSIFACYSDIRGQRSDNGGQQWSFDYSGHSANSMYRIAVHPNGNVYAGTSNIHDIYQSTYLTDARLDGPDGNGKVMFSTNQGFTWQLMHDFGHPVFWVALDPNNPERMYASVIHSATGGIYVTNNLSAGSGSTWVKLNNPPRTEGHPASIVVLNDGQVLVTYSGRRNGSGTFTASSGCFLYNGTTWSDKSDPGMFYWSKDVVVDPTDPSQNTWIVCVFSGWGGAPNGLGGIYRTTNRGANWTKINSQDRVTSLTFWPANPNDAYYTTESEGLWFSANMLAANPTFQQVSAYRFSQPERVFFNPNDLYEIWVTSFGNGMSAGFHNGTPLSIKWLSLNAHHDQEEAVNISWSFLYDGPINKMSLERSGDARKFTPIYSTKPEFNPASNTISQTYIDKDPLTPVNYYRIRIEEPDHTWYSPLYRIEHNDQSIEIYPNPVSADNKLLTITSIDPLEQIKIYDASGRLVHQQILQDNAKALQIELGTLPFGIYNVQVFSAHKIKSKMIQVQ